MSDRMTTIPLENLLNWIFTEYKNHKTIFGIASSRFFKKSNAQKVEIFDEVSETPLGPAAGPHTQLTQNIIVSYLLGSRFLELKTVQILDRLEINKPCIDVEDEGYNIEWSQELTLEESFDEYLKAWFLLPMLARLLGLSPKKERAFIFNMSVGYDLKGIKTERMDRFINQLIDASNLEAFTQYKSRIQNWLRKNKSFILEIFSITESAFEEILSSIEETSGHISGSVTLSTMHGCPPQEIEAIARYLIKEKNLHTYVKLNPTLLGYDEVKRMLDQLGYRYIKLDPAAFDHDLQYSDAIPMLQRLIDFGKKHNKTFGIKLSNTLGIINPKKKLDDDQMYLSGRALFPLTINLAYKLSKDFKGHLNISYSGGAYQENITHILECGIYPVTVVTDLLKPGGYMRLNQMLDKIEVLDYGIFLNGKIDLEKLKNLAANSMIEKVYRKETREIESIKIPEPLGKYDCYVAPCQEACPVHQDVAEYIRLVEEERYVEAFETIVERNPFPHVTGYICDHECTNHCTRWDYDEPLNIREIKKVAAENGFETYFERFKKEYSVKKNGIKVAVIGAGPAGMSAGYFLAKEGFEVTILEKNDKPGGVIQNSIPDFRLPQSAIDADIQFIEGHGINYRLGADKNFNIPDLQKEGFKYIFVAIGASTSKDLTVPGFNEKIMVAIDFLHLFNQRKEYNLGKNVAVIGAGSSAMDAARASKRTPGVENVYCIYRRTLQYMPAHKDEYTGALDDDVIFKELLLPYSWNDGILTCQKMQLGEIDTDGRRKVSPVENEFEDIKIDSIISAIGEQVEHDLLKSAQLTYDDTGILYDKKTLETGSENVFVGGDTLRGPDSVIKAIADGKKFAEMIIKKEKGSRPKEPDFSGLFNEQRLSKDMTARNGQLFPMLQNNMQQEASRCLSCNYVCDKCVDVCPNRANITLQSDLIDDRFKHNGQILHIDGMCNECGNCETFCPYTGSPYIDKITLFWSERDFDDSENDGFYILDDGSGNGQDHHLKIRFNSKIGSAYVQDNNGKFQASAKGVEQGEALEFFLNFIYKVIKNYSYLLLPQ